MLRLGFAEICGVLVVGWEIPKGECVSAGVSGLGDDAGVGYVAIADESLWVVGPRQGCVGGQGRERSDSRWDEVG